MKETTGLSNRQKAELDVLACLPEDGIQRDDIPEILDLSEAKRRVSCHPVKSR